MKGFGMSEEALRRALAQIATTDGDGEHMRGIARAALSAALSEGQAPEPVAQEPVAYLLVPPDDGRESLLMHARERPMALAIRDQGYTLRTLVDAAGMDAARAKAICQCAAEGSYYGQHASWCPLHGAKKNADRS